MLFRSSSVTSLSANVDSLSSNVSALAGDMSTLTGNVSTLTGNVATLTGNVSTLAGNVSTLTGNVSTLTGDVSTLTSNVSTLTSNVSTLTGNVSTLTGNVSTLTGNVSTLTGNVSTLTGNVSTLTGNVATLTGNVATLTGNVATLTGNVSTITSNVALLSTTVSGISSTGGTAGFDVVLLIGQSNMVGYDESNTLDTYLGYAVLTSERIFQLGQRTYTSNGVSMNRTNRTVPVTEPLDHALPFDIDRAGKRCASIGMGFARLYEHISLSTKRKLLLVPCAWQGTGFTGGGGSTSTNAGGQSVVLSWDASYASNMSNSTPNLLRLARDRLRIALAYDPLNNPNPTSSDSPASGNAFKAILWHQGEYNIQAGTSEASYRTLLTALVQYLRDAVPGSNTVPFVAGLPHDRYLDTFGYRNAPTANCLRKVGDSSFFGLSSCGFADSKGLTAYNDYHFDNAGYNTYGLRYFQAYTDVAAGNVFAAVYNLQANANVFTAALTWVPSNVTSANVSLSTDGGVTYTAATANVTTGAANVSGLTPSTSYTFRVVPSRSGVAGAAVTVAASTIADPNAPTISALSASAASSTSLTVTWTPSASVTSVTLETSTNSGATYSAPQSFASSPATLANLSASTTYTVRATPYAGNTAGTAQTTSASTSSGIELLSLSASGPTASALSVSWTASGSVTSVTIEASTDGGSTYGAAQTFTASPSVLTDLTANTTYTVRVTPYASAVAGTAQTTSAATLAALSGSGIGTVANGLILHVTFGTSSVPTTDERTNALTAVNTPTMTTLTPRGYVLNSVASGGYLRTTLDLPQTYSKSAWVYCTSASNYPNVVSSDTPFSTPNVPRDYLFINGGIMTGGHSPNDTTQNICQDTVAMSTQLNTWIHFVFTWDNSANTGVLYRNATAVRTVTNSAYNRATVSGKISIANFARNFPWQGYIDNVRVYNRVLTGAEVTSIYTAETM